MSSGVKAARNFLAGAGMFGLCISFASLISEPVPWKEALQSFPGAVFLVSLVPQMRLLFWKDHRAQHNRSWNSAASSVASQRPLLRRIR